MGKASSIGASVVPSRSLPPTRKHRMTTRDRDGRITGRGLDVVLLIAMLSGCITPPVVLEGERRGIRLAEFPPATEEVVVCGANGNSLHGVFVPSDPGAPVVVHFLESGCSITQGSIDFPSLEVVWQLRDLGFASLAMDYSGVGASEGDRSPDNLAPDAEAMWEEAVRRADGLPGRVVLRGMSIGTLAAASLLDRGVRPGGVVLIAPVRGETVASHYVDERMGKPFAGLVSLFYKSAVPEDLAATLSRTRVPLLSILPAEDSLLPEDERRFVRYAVRSARGRSATLPGLDHIDAVLEAHRLLEAEAALLRELFPELPPIDSRVERILAGTPGWLNAGDSSATASTVRLRDLVAAWYVDDPEVTQSLAAALPPSLVGQEAVLDWFRSLPHSQLGSMPEDALHALFNFEDRAGTLDVSELPSMQRLVRGWQATNGDALTPSVIVERARAFGLADVAFAAAPSRRYTQLYEGEQMVRRGSAEVGAPTIRLRHPAPDSFRQAVRLLLKSWALPDRESGEDTLDVWIDGSWHELGLDRPERAPSDRRLGK